MYQDHVMETQFLIGKNFMFAPILELNATARLVTLPYGVRWYRFIFNEKTARVKSWKLGELNISNSIEEQIPMLVREGTVLFMQDTV